MARSLPSKAPFVMRAIGANKGAIYVGPAMGTQTAVTVLIAIACSGCCAGSQALERRMGPEYEPETQSWLAQVRKRGGDGMWLVTRGYHTGDDLVAVATNSPLSHTSVLDAHNMRVVEAIGEGVVVTELPQFLRETHRMLLIKPDGWTPRTGAKALEMAYTKVGDKYDFLGAVGLPNDKLWYCSELAAWSMGMPTGNFGAHNVLHPKDMHRYGEVLFDTGQRDGMPDEE